MRELVSQALVIVFIKFTNYKRSKSPTTNEVTVALPVKALLSSITILLEHAISSLSHCRVSRSAPLKAAGSTSLFSPLRSNYERCSQVTCMNY